MSLSVKTTDSVPNKGGAPEGNQNAKKGKIFSDEIRKFLTQNPQKKREIVEGLVEAAVAREPWAVKEIMDRMEGKPIQATDITSSDGTVVSAIAMSFVEPNGNKD
jgi:hypothetical protein